MTRQRIAIDMDEVLADTLGAVVKAVNERFKYQNGIIKR